MTGAEGLPQPLGGLLLKLLEPEKVTPKEALRALRRARRTGALWRALTQMERALLTAAAHTRVTEYRSPKLKALLAKIIAKLEAHTPKGMVLAAAVRRALTLNPLLASLAPQALASTLKRKLSYLLYLGRSMLEVIDYYTPWRT